MNNWQDEFLAEYDRQRILQEVEQIRLEKLALGSRPYLFARLMVRLAAWLISSGSQLRRRYKVPGDPRVTHSEKYYHSLIEGGRI